MRVVIYYVIPAVALILVLTLLFVRSKRPSVSSGERPLVSAPTVILILAVAGAIGVAIFIFAVDVLNLI